MPGRAKPMPELNSALGRQTLGDERGIRVPERASSG